MKPRIITVQTWKMIPGMGWLMRAKLFEISLTIYGVRLFSIELMQYLDEKHIFGIELLGVGINIMFEWRRNNA